MQQPTCSPRAALPLTGGRRWAIAARQERESYGSQKWKARQAQQLEAARASPAVQRRLRADVRIYAAARDRFESLSRAAHVRR